MTFKKRFILIFILTSLISILFLQTYIVGRYSLQQREKISSFIDQNIYNKKNILNAEIIDYQQILINIMGDKLFSDTLDTLLKKNPEYKEYWENTIENIFSQNTYMKEGLIGFFYYEESSELVLGYNKQLISPEDFWSSMGGIKKSISTIEDNRGAISYLDTVALKGFSGESRNVLVLGSRFTDLNRFLKRGYIFILISEESIYNLLNPQDLINNSVFSETYLLSASRILVSGKNKSKLGSLFPVSENINRNGRDKYLTREISIDKLQWLIVTSFRERELFGEVYVFTAFILVIGLISLSLTLFITRKYIFRIINSVTDLRSSLKIENDQLLFNVTTDDDLDYLGQSFKHMREHINRLLTDQKMKNIEMFEIQESKRLAEIRAIEAQVNPHFLYNTLNSLNWIALENDDTVMSEALTDLAGILRYSISEIETTTTLEQEMLWLEQYLRLQKLRFVDLFEYTLVWDKQLAHFKMYKLLFQPFIENAIIHGFDGINYTGKLKITVLPHRDESILITIDDNGCGFSFDVIQASTGLNNPQSRMELYYRGEADLKIDSNVGKGTTVTIMIPGVKK